MIAWKNCCVVLLLTAIGAAICASAGAEDDPKTNDASKRPPRPLFLKRLGLPETTKTQKP